MVSKKAMVGAKCMDKNEQANEVFHPNFMAEVGGLVSDGDGSSNTERKRVLMDNRGLSLGCLWPAPISEVYISHVTECLLLFLGHFAKDVGGSSSVSNAAAVARSQADVCSRRASARLPPFRSYTVAKKVSESESESDEGLGLCQWSLELRIGWAICNFLRAFSRSGISIGFDKRIANTVIPVPPGTALHQLYSVPPTGRLLGCAAFAAAATPSCSAMKSRSRGSELK
nr:hypothetical protein Iba_chr14cCG6750 [Ipomoea batatas]